ncbi:FMO4 monooxygenase, partial [Columbina picui]|nr:FMO4 monooxygenase [Columbina picui]
MVQRVAIIGGGVGGLASIKCCLDEGLEPTCFERSEDIGGLWRYTDSTDGGRVTVYRSVITNTSKEMSCFSDFPFPEDFPNYLPHSLLLEYFRMYAQHFDLLQHIRFKTTVVSVRKRPDFAASGQWEVITETDGVQESHIFDAVMVCTGHYQEPYLPLASFPGKPCFSSQTCFKGRYLHSQEYKDAEAFREKRVLVVGIGNTGGDLSVELSRVAAKVFVSTRSSTWLFSRVSDHGFPLDMVNTTRFKHFLDWLLPSALMKWIKFRKFNSWFNHANYGLASTKSSYFKVIINEELPFCLLSGTVVLKPSVKEFTESSAVFEDGTKENIDVVLFATGYISPFPFLEESVRSLFDNNQTGARTHVFPLQHSGFSESRAFVFCGAGNRGRKTQFDFLCLFYVPLRNPTERENLKINFMSYTDDIASCAGVKPSVLRLLLTDPRLALAIFFGPCTPYQYRLVGRGKWSGAREAILTQWQRTLKPLRTRVVDDSSDSSSGWCWRCLLALPAALMVGFLFSKYPRMGWSSQAGSQL